MRSPQQGKILLTQRRGQSDNDSLRFAGLAFADHTDAVNSFT
jgi:hypothetical protein